ARQRDDDAAMWEIDTWLMSCRVIGRKLEELMLTTLADAAREHGAQKLRGVYIPTAKNAIVADLLPRLGFRASGRDGDAQFFDFDVTARQSAACDHIRVLQST